MLPQSRVLLLLALAVASSAAAGTNELCVPPATPVLTDGGIGPRCPECCASFLKLPFQEWSKERSQPSAFKLPWGQEYPFAPLDYPAIASQLCECLEHIDEQPGVAAAVLHQKVAVLVQGRPIPSYTTIMWHSAFCCPIIGQCMGSHVDEKHSLHA